MKCLFECIFLLKGVAIDPTCIYFERLQLSANGNKNAVGGYSNARKKA